jgi:hypothetical protein
LKAWPLLRIRCSVVNFLLVHELAVENPKMDLYFVADGAGFGMPSAMPTVL